MYLQDFKNKKNYIDTELYTEPKLSHNILTILETRCFHYAYWPQKWQF